MTSTTMLPVAAALAEMNAGPHRTLFASRTALYTLGKGETVDSVAKKFGVSVPELKKLNEFRKYNKPFEQLGAGDEVDVPVQVSQGTKNTLPADTNIDASKPDAEGLFIANSMSTMGSMLDSGDVTHQAAGMARSAAVGAASGEVEDWLSQFGTARVQLNLDDEFNLDGSAIDLLVPLYDNHNHILFTQWGLRNKDSRNTVNLGLGARTFQGHWMFGVNAFYDDDMTGHNRRIGMGVEAWTDYLKLSANSYNGITNWHQSRDFADYDERPADGFDIRAEGYLPAYPQLGAKLMYEQYRGDEVALFGKDDRQKDPKAVTLGLNYTPIPLLTVGVDHRQGQSGQNDTQVNVEMNYRLGVPWLQQVDPDAVASSRTLAGSRYDLVDRNNDIVLEYKKQTLIRLSLPQSLRGKAGDTDHVTATVTAKYGTDHIEWNTGDLLAAGGTAKEVSKQVLEITYPPFKAEGSNTYHLSAVAYDSKGNASNQSATEVSVSEPDASIVDGNLTFTVDGAKANGIATDTVEALVTDNAKHGVPGMDVVFTADNGAKIVGGDKVTTNADGKATITLTNTKAGDVMVTAKVNSSEVSTKGSFVADGDTADITDGNLVVTTDNAKANGADANAVQATVTDVNGNAVKDQVVTFSADNGATIASPTVKTDENGVATTTLTNTKAGTANVTATLADGKSATKATTFTADDSTAVIADGALTVTTDNAKANGTDTNAVKAVVTDASGNLVVGTKVTFAASNGAKVLTQSVNTDKNGVATTTLTNPTAGSANVTATLTDGNTANVDTHFNADGDTADITDGNLTVTSD
ncbi:MAG: inverse autotransporter beta domain-containing protein, partial [Citrobacter sp.]